MHGTTLHDDGDVRPLGQTDRAFFPLGIMSLHPATVISQFSRVYAKIFVLGKYTASAGKTMTLYSHYDLMCPHACRICNKQSLADTASAATISEKKLS